MCLRRALEGRAGAKGYAAVAERRIAVLQGLLETALGHVLAEAAAPGTLREVGARIELTLDRSSLWAGLFDLRDNLLGQAIEDLRVLTVA